MLCFIFPENYLSHFEGNIYNHFKISYQNSPQSIGYNQTISQPYIVGYMLDQLNIKKNNKILEIGTGSGYNAAILSKLVGPGGLVVTIEIVKPLATSSK